MANKLILACLFIVSKLSYVGSLPHFMLTTKAAKCFRVEVVRNTTYEFKYAAPDLIVTEGEEKKEGDSIILDHGHRDEHQREVGKDGLDSRYEEVFRRRMEAMKRASMKDINIVLIEKNDVPESFGRVDPQRNKKRVIELIEKKHGTFNFTTSEDHDGFLEICVQSYTASGDTPSRVGLSVSSKQLSSPVFTYGTTASENIVLPAEANPGASLHGELILNLESSRVSQALEHFEKLIEEIIEEAGSAVEKEEAFQDLSARLSKAVHYWPKFRMGVLVVTTILQVHHVAQYMKRRHLV